MNAEYIRYFMSTTRPCYCDAGYVCNPCRDIHPTPTPVEVPTPAPVEDDYVPF